MFGGVLSEDTVHIFFVRHLTDCQKRYIHNLFLPFKFYILVKVIAYSIGINSSDDFFLIKFFIHLKFF